MDSDPGIVLVADNDPHVAQVLRIFLERVGLEVELAADGGSARERLAAGGVAVLVCDLDMPVLSGEALIAQLATATDDRARRALAIFVVSGYVDRSLELRLRRSPLVREVIRKPFDLASFADRVKDCVRVRDQDRMHVDDDTCE